MARTIICPYCGMHNEVDDSYCANCGKKLSVSSARKQNAPIKKAKTKTTGSRSKKNGIIIFIIAIVILGCVAAYVLISGKAGIPTAPMYYDYGANKNYSTYSISPSANKGMFEVSQYINGFDYAAPVSDDDIPYYNIEGNFPANSYDYDVIKLFSDFRNDILRSAYHCEGRQITKRKVMDYYSGIVSVICLDKRIEWQNHGVIVDYSELSDQGKRTFLELAKAVLSIDLPYEMDYNGEYYFYKEDLNRDVRNKLNEVTY